MSVRLKAAADLITSCESSNMRPFVALEHLESGTGRLLMDAELADRAVPDTGAASVEPGDVLFGKLRPYLAKTWLADRPAFASTELLCLRPRIGIDSRWLAYVVTSGPFVDWAVASSDGTKMPRTSWEKISEYRIKSLPVATQRAIADYLDVETARIDALIEKKRRMIEVLEEQFRAYRWHEVSKGARPHPIRATSFVVRPNSGWGQTRLKYLVEQPVAGAWGGEAGDDEVNVACYRVADFNRWLGTATSTEPTVRSISRVMLRRIAILRDDLLLEKSGGGENQPVGFVARFVESNDRAICSNFIARLRPVVGNDPIFVAHVFAALYDQRMTLPFIKQSTGIQNFDTDTYISQEWPIPHLNEQIAIRQNIELFHERISLLVGAIQQQTQLLVEHRHALITAAVAGPIDHQERVA